MKLSIIVAVALNGVIGRAGQLPWRLPADLRHFKATTLGKPVVMGRRTWQSIGRPLPGRRNIVISRDPTFRAGGAETFTSLDAALAVLGREVEVMIIGGAELYRQALPRADHLYLTRVQAEVPGDVFFPEPGPAWHLVSETIHPADAANAFALHLQEWRRG